jgi:hypothetical protein
MLDDEEFDEEDTGPIRLWPAVVVLVLFAIGAAVVAVLALKAGDKAAVKTSDEPMTVVALSERQGGVVRLVTREAGCRRPEAVRATRAGQTVRIEIQAGPTPQGSCSAGIKVACSEILLPQRLASLTPRPEPSAAPEPREPDLLNVPGCPRRPLAVSG